MSATRVLSCYWAVCELMNVLRDDSGGRPGSAQSTRPTAHVHAGPGFADLPEVIQSHILALHLTGCPAGRSCGVRGVSKCFNSCAWLHDRAQQQLDIASDQIACLSYLPRLQAVVCSKPEMSVSGFVHRVLRFPMPHLVSLTLQCQCLADAPSLVATVARFPQLTELSLAVEVNVEAYEPQLQATPPLTLTDLTCLRSLSIHQRCVRSLAGSTVLAVSMAALSGMHMLTPLHVRLNSVDAFEDQGWLDLTTTPTMISVSRSLGKVSELRELVLSFWDSYAFTHGPLVDSCWQSFAEVLPTLQHLTRLGMISMLVGNHPTWQQALVTGLYGAPCLRHLALTGYSRFPLIDHGPEAGQLAGLHEASAILARTLGSLTALTQLELADLQQGVGVHDCCVHLRTLTALRSLTLDVLPLEDELASRVTSISSMLACMPRLTNLVFRCISCDDNLVCHMNSEHTTCSASVSPEDWR